eukprot:3091877-Rhodomonas_salina.1
MAETSRKLAGKSQQMTASGIVTMNGSTSTINGSTGTINGGRPALGVLGGVLDLRLEVLHRPVRQYRSSRSARVAPIGQRRTCYGSVSVRE